jgi:DNA-binding NarL/FixJ family response regulator
LVGELSNPGVDLPTHPRIGVWARDVVGVGWRVNTAKPKAVRRAFVVEDIVQTRDWLTELLRKAFGDIDVAWAGDLKTARAWMAGQTGAMDGLVALVDLGLPDGSGIDLIREIRDRHPAIQAVVTTVYDDDSHLVHAIAAGAHGYLLKDRDAEELIGQLRGIERGEAAISPAIARRILEQFRVHATFMAASDADGPALTVRETDVLRLIGRGLTLGEAAGVLAISSQTVATHVKNIYRKLGIASRAEAALEASRRSLT